MKKQFAILCAAVLLVGLTGCKAKPQAAVRPVIAAPQETVPQEIYESPIDFAALQAQNSDVYAWLDIPDTEISYPILQHSTDNAYYLRHDIDGNRSSDGALFTEDYNHTDFEDPVTIVYGHHTYNGTFFGTLQNYYEDAEQFRQHQKIMVYMPDCQHEYKVVAAVPYNNHHILFNYDFTQKTAFSTFFDRVYSVRSLVANFDANDRPAFGQRILILSTCLKGDHSQRYLVIAKENEPV